jgi:hypothetical protein
MKRYFVFLIALFVSAAVYAQHRDRNGVIHVQGHPHELLTIKHGGKEDAKKVPQLTGTSTDSIKLSDIICWAGSPDSTLRIDSAVLLIKFTIIPDVEYVHDSILIWGYRWNPVDKYGYDIKKYTVDMIRAVANADCRFSALLQNSSGGDIVAGGFGYNYDETSLSISRVPVRFYYDAAVTDTLIRFHYDSLPNCTMAQGAVPYDVDVQWQEALKRGGANITDTGNGIIRHPFDADYGYPAYDFDYWQQLPWPVTRPYAWQAGWYHNYWTFYSKDQLIGPFDYSEYGIATREIHHGYVDGFVFNSADPLSTPHDMSGTYNLPNDCNCGCTGVNAIVEQKGKRK